MTEKLQICPYCGEPVEGPLLVADSSNGSDLIRDLERWRDTGYWPTGEHDFPDRILETIQDLTEKNGRLEDTLARIGRLALRAFMSREQNDD